MTKILKQNQQSIELKELQTKINEQQLSTIKGGSINIHDGYNTSIPSFGFTDNRNFVEQIEDLFNGSAGKLWYINYWCYASINLEIYSNIVENNSVIYAVIFSRWSYSTFLLLLY